VDLGWNTKTAEGCIDVADSAAYEVLNEAPLERTWLFVGDFLFYLRLLARQFANLANQHGGDRKSMVIVPESSMAWDQLESGQCEVVFLDCAEATESHLEFVRTLRSRHPQIRRILVSAALNKKMESELMEAGAHLCFSKPRSAEETSSVYQMVSALCTSRGFCPDGAYKGMAPAKFIQFLCARNESGVVAMDTERGKAILVIEDGRIVDASLGDLHGDAAASMILSFDRTERCHFKHMLNSQYHTVHLHTHQLWLDSAQVEVAVPKDPSMARQTPPTKSLGETLAALDALEKISLHIELDAEEILEIGSLEQSPS
jgi:DNA-binding NarL/FixJ family response regulator